MIIKGKVSNQIMLTTANHDENYFRETKLTVCFRETKLTVCLRIQDVVQDNPIHTRNISALLPLNLSPFSTSLEAERPITIQRYYTMCAMNDTYMIRCIVTANLICDTYRTQTPICSCDNSYRGDPC